VSAPSESAGPGDVGVALLLGPLAWAQLELGGVATAAATVERAQA
jgi:hypothetical protein